MTTPPDVKGSNGLLDGITYKDQKARVFAALVAAAILGVGGFLVKWIFPIFWDKLIPWLPIILCVLFFILYCWQYFRLRKHRGIHNELEARFRELESNHATIAEKVSNLESENQRLATCFPEGWEGIRSVTGLIGYFEKLEGSPYHPENCLDHITHHLDFMGHGARKWTSNKTQLEEMLKRVKIRNGSVRFLILDPKQEKEPHEAREIADSIKSLIELKKKYNNVDIKIYEHPPQFRLMFLENSTLVLGHYKGINRGDSINTPLYVYTEKPDWSFYYAFQSHFKAEWKAASDPDWEEINRLAE